MRLIISIYSNSAALCGMLGYRQFFRDDWLEVMLSWQWPRGCWGSLRPPHPKGESSFLGCLALLLSEIITLENVYHVCGLEHFKYNQTLCDVIHF